MTQNQIGPNTTSSSPFVAPGDVIYFRGTDNRLLTIDSDGSNSFQIGTNTTSSSPLSFLTRWAESGYIFVEPITNCGRSEATVLGRI